MSLGHHKLVYLPKILKERILSGFPHGKFVIVLFPFPHFPLVSLFPPHCLLPITHDLVYYCVTYGPFRKR
jgi:hypothetical protein